MPLVLQVRGMVGRPGGLAAAVGLAAVAVLGDRRFTNRRKFRDMMPCTVAILMVVQGFFLLLIAFVVSPFEVLVQGKGIVDVGDGQGLNPLLQYWTMVDPSADPVSRLRRLHGPVRVRHGVADHQAARRRLDSHHPPLDARDLVLPEHRDPARRGLGLRGARLGRLLGLGSG